MEYRALGDTGLTVSAIGFGCWEMGNPGYGSTDDSEVIAAVHRAMELGVTLFEVMTGELPFKGRDFGYHHVHTTPPSPRSVNQIVSEDMDKIILKCLEKKPEDRWGNAASLGDAVRAATL